MEGPTRRLVQAAAEAAAAVRRRWAGRPRVGLILGTGQGALVEELAVEAVLPFAELPQFARSTALSHRGQLVCGRWCEMPLVILDGRCHLYEGYAFEQLMLPVYTLRALGVETLLISNAAGGLNPRFARGDVMLVEDHVGFFFGRRAREPAEDWACEPRRSAQLYDRRLLAQALEISRRQNFAAYLGVYAAMLGPNFETRAEYRSLRKLGADAVGMSTVPEAVAAARCGMQTLAVSIITNVARPDHPDVVQAGEVVAAAQAAEPKVQQIAAGILRSLADSPPRET